MYELQILLGYNCNFSCNHCINSSSPGNTTYDITDKDMDVIIDTVQKNKNIHTVSFTGGEPLLYLDSVEYIIDKIHNLRPNVYFSLTTNGSLLKKYEKKLASMKIDACLLSFDEEHNQYTSKDKFLNYINCAREIFSRVEVNVTYEDDILINSLSEDLLETNVKINFNKKINSGRFAKEYIKKSKDIKIQKFSCPNFSSKDNEYKITYIPRKGFTICCGPLVFDKIIEDSKLFSARIEEMDNNFLFRLMKKIEDTPLRISQDAECNMCKNILQNYSMLYLEKFMSGSNWNNVLVSWTYDDLDKFSQIFNPKYIKKVDKLQFVNYLLSRNLENEKVKEFEGSFLDKNGINEFSVFTIRSFYDKHVDQYAKTDIVRFISDQSVFFNLPYRYIYHKIDDNIVAYLVLCEIEVHPFFNEKVWHVGYWGISDEISRNDKDFIKKSWGRVLSDINMNFPIVANIDYFNKSADMMSDKFNFKVHGVRLDPRV